MTRFRLWLRFAAVAVGVLVVLALVEKAGRSVPRLMPPQWQLLHAAILKDAESTPIPDPEIGFLPRPGPDTDSKGFPNSDPWPHHASIVFLGDSLVVAPGVPLSAKFTTLVGDLLPDQPVINLGVNAAGVERQTLLFRRFGIPLRPRSVVACLYLATDFSNDRRFRSWVQQGRGEEFFTYRIPGDHGEYVRPLDRLRTLQWGALLEQSWLFVKARELAISWTQGRDAIEERYRFPDGTETLFARGGLEFANTPVAANDPRIDELLTSLAHLRTLVEQHGARLIVALLPSAEELFRATAAAEKSNIVGRTKARLTSAGFSVLDFYPALRTAGRSRTPYLINESHLNAYGHQIVAQRFVTWFREQ
jgi:hypothetical protein